MEPIRYSGKVGDGNQVVVNDCDGLIPALGEDTSQRIAKLAADAFVVRFGPTSPKQIDSMLLRSIRPTHAGEPGIDAPVGESAT